MVRLLSLPMFIAGSISFIFFMFFLFLMFRIIKNDEERNRFFKAYLIFLVLSLVNSVYVTSFGIMLNSANNLDVLDISNRITIVSSMFVMVLYIHFIKKFFNLKDCRIIYFFYLVNIVFTILTAFSNPLFLFKDFFKTSTYYTGLKFGFLFQIWGVYFAIILIYAIAFLFTGFLKIKKEDASRRKPFIYLLAATFSCIIVGFLDSLTAVHVIDLPPLSWIGSISIVTTIAYILIISFEKLYKKVDNLYNELIHDSLTQAYSKSFFDIRFDSVYNNLSREDSLNCLILFDIDDFKKINDNHGHLCGDHVLKKTIMLVKKHLRGNDILARYGGDEFLILITNCIDSKNILTMLERLRKEISFHIINFRNQKIKLTCSFGISFFNQETYREKITCDDILAAADNALYKSKENGKNSIEMLNALRMLSSPEST